MKSKKILVAALLMLSAIATPALSKSWTDVDYVGDGMVGHKMDIHVPDDGKATHKVIVLIYALIPQHYNLTLFISS